MIVAIHQPNFMPWYPFFQKIAAADTFVVLTHCQFEKNNYQNRFNQRERWHTLSVNKALPKPSLVHSAPSAYTPDAQPMMTIMRPAGLT